MWITTVLFYRHVPGRIFSGKHRAVMKVTKYQRKRVDRKNQQIESNMELLSFPFLTVSQEHSHATARKHKERKDFFDKIKQNRTLGKTAVHNVTNSSRTPGLLQHLNVTKP
ncbi:ribosomal protein 63, mitochondrial-like [Dendronephthya gigantea]|uniref:ribosomal protein 63, mitochondrial-like n=1 Tax=Dendronephthya gigantea TaxID=151771 RepID=UPI00106CB20D|nr:ribosomal protein 63, mitochondrial-like [Dendronephthya gigantea]